jgi:hypothetical protein
VSLGPGEKLLTEAEIRALVRSQRRVLRSLARATPEQRASIYPDMGLRVTYSPEEPERVAVEVDACMTVRVGGGTATNPDWRLSSWPGPQLAYEVTPSLPFSEVDSWFRYLP